MTKPIMIQVYTNQDENKLTITNDPIMLQVYTTQNKISNNILALKKTRNKYYSDISLYYRTDTTAKAKTYIESLTKLEAKILSYLFSFHDKKFIKLKNSTIALKADCSVITVQRATAKFKRDGWVDKEQANHVYNVNSFRFMVPLHLLFYVQMLSITQNINAKRKLNKSSVAFLLPIENDIHNPIPPEYYSRERGNFLSHAEMWWTYLKNEAENDLKFTKYVGKSPNKILDAMFPELKPLWTQKKIYNPYN